MIRSLLLAVALALQAAAASATVVTAQYTSLGGNDWAASFTVQNDGTPPEIGGFTIYFPETEFTALTLSSSPATWDTLAVQPDLGLPSAGFVDSYAILPADELSLGQSVGGFEVEFTYLGQGEPGRLSFDIVDRNFQILFSGRTTVLPVNVVPVPNTPLLMVFACLCLLASCRSRRRPWGGNRLRAQ